MSARSDEILIKLEFFGILRDMVGEKELNVKIPCGYTILDLLNILSETYGQEFKSFVINPHTNQLWCYFSLAINNELVEQADLKQELCDGDNIKFLFPIVGG